VDQRERLGDSRTAAQISLLGDAHFLITAVYHMIKALQGMPTGPALPKPLGKQIELLRNELEHWWDAQYLEGAWKGLAENHGRYASPWTANQQAIRGSYRR
jgi:hypothetical protein